MAQSTMKFEKLTTPRGVFIFPYVNTPDKKYGKFQVRVNVTAEYAEQLIAKLQPMAEAKMAEVRLELEEKLATAKGKDRVKAEEALKELKLGNLPVREAYDDGADEPNGTYEVSFSAPGTKKDPKTRVESPRVIAIFDSQGNEVKPAPAVYGGTEGKVSGFIATYYNPASNSCGVSLRLMAVQVLKLVSGGGSASMHGFGKEEDGFVADDLPKQDAPASGDDAGATSGDDF